MPTQTRTTAPRRRRQGRAPATAGPRCAGARPFVRGLAIVAALAFAGSAATGGYVVRRGDTLSGIASRHGVSTRDLAAANRLVDPDRVIAGRTLQIPGRTAAAAAPAGPATYVVRAGDTLGAIAARHGTSAQVLATSNGITRPDRIRAGSTLRLPASTPSASGVASAGTVARSGLPSRLQASPARLALIPTFERWAATYGVPADLLMAMTWLESGWQMGVVSSTGAVGIGQLMPATVRWMEDIVIREPLDVHDADDNIRMAARYLRWLLDRSGGDVRLALAGYYQGPASVRARGLLPETERYVADIVALRAERF